MKEAVQAVTSSPEDGDVPMDVKGLVAEACNLSYHAQCCTGETLPLLTLSRRLGASGALTCVCVNVCVKKAAGMIHFSFILWTWLGFNRLFSKESC